MPKVAPRQDAAGQGRGLRMDQGLMRHAGVPAANFRRRLCALGAPRPTFSWTNCWRKYLTSMFPTINTEPREPSNFLTTCGT